MVTETQNIFQTLILEYKWLLKFLHRHNIANKYTNLICAWVTDWVVLHPT